VNWTCDDGLYNALVFVDAYMWCSDLNLNYICLYVYMLWSALNYILFNFFAEKSTVGAVLY
jgi:hypothetical protein